MVNERRSGTAIGDRTTAPDLWFEREVARRRREEDFPPANTGLRPAERFSDEYAPADPDVAGERGPKSSAIRSVIAGACSGWARRPDSREFYEAMRTDEPTKRQLTLAGVLIAEGSMDEVLLGYLQGAFTWRQLARMMHLRGVYTGQLARYVNIQGEPE